MNHPLHKFPRTPHLVWLGEGAPRDDKLLSAADAEAFLAGSILVEEKVDGANLGLSLTPAGELQAQNRGHFLRPGESAPQWNPLWPWLAAHANDLAKGLQGGLVLYGEWCFARHSVFYDALPDWFLGFDIFCPATNRYWPADRRNAWLQHHGLTPVPKLRRACFTLPELLVLMGPSTLGHTVMEGIYLRRESGGGLDARAKIVNAAFHAQLGEHWSRRAIEPNRLARGDEPAPIPRKPPLAPP